LKNFGVSHGRVIFTTTASYAPITGAVSATFPSAERQDEMRAEAWFHVNGVACSGHSLFFLTHT
jgi:isocitrate dehydrogenase kinase/phosphatase